MELKNIKISAESPFSADAVLLMEELSNCLLDITGNSGKSSFDPNDVCGEKSMFVISRDQYGKAVGCGSFRPMDESTAEIKRMYAKEKGIGIGNKILTFLEIEAKRMGYKTLCLETRIINTAAVSFYEKNGYIRTPNYGKYIGRIDAVCFKKDLS